MTAPQKTIEQRRRRNGPLAPSADATKIVRKVEHADDCMCTTCFGGHYVERPAFCHHNEPREHCSACREVRDMLRAIPAKGRAFTGAR